MSASSLYPHGYLIAVFFCRKKILDLFEHMREKNSQHIIHSGART